MTDGSAFVSLKMAMTSERSSLQTDLLWTVAAIQVGAIANLSQPGHGRDSRRQDTVKTESFMKT